MSFVDHFPSRLGPVLAAALLAACAVGPEHVAPEPQLGAEASATARVAARVAAPAPALDRWWTGFGDADLDRAVERALAANPSLDQALARVDQARAGLGAANAALLPAGEAGTSAARAHSSQQDAIGRVRSALGDRSRDTSLYALDARAQWEIDLAGGLRRNAEAARADYAATAADAGAARLAVIAATADGYVLLRTLQARLALAREQVETRTRLVTLVERQQERGLAPQRQLDAARGALAEIAASVPVLDAGLDASYATLDMLEGQPAGSARAELATARPIPAPPGIDTAGGTAAMLRRRPDVIAAERRLAAADARIGVALADYYPKLSLGALLGSTTTLAGNLLAPGAGVAQASAGLRWRLFDFGRVDAEVAAARGRRAEALAAWRQTVLGAAGEAETALSALVNNEARMQTLADGEAAVLRARSATALAHARGVVALAEVLDADERVQRVRDGVILARADSARAAIGSFRALGGGWSAP